MKPFSVLFVLAVISLATTTAMAQTEPRVAVSGSIGAATGRSDTGVAAGGALLFDVHERVSIEGQGTYLKRGAGADAFSLGGSVLVNLVPRAETLVPYAAVGGGLYHVSFDLDTPRFLGPAGTQFAAGTRVCAAPGSGFGYGAGPGFGSGTGTCPATVGGYWGVGELPAFYARRLGVLDFPGGAQWGARDFTDPALSLGGGVRFHINDRLMVRPDARALVIFGDGDTHTIGVFVVHVGYRF
jgi:hypothetical protein